MRTEPILCTNIVSHKLMFESINSLTTSVRAGNIIASVLYVGKLGLQKGFVNTRSHSQPYQILTLRSLCMKCNGRAVFWCFVLGHGSIQWDPEHNLMLSKSFTKQPRQEEFNITTFSYTDPAKNQDKTNQFLKPSLKITQERRTCPSAKSLFYTIYTESIFLNNSMIL